MSMHERLKKGTLVAAATIACLVPATALQAATLTIDGTMYTETGAGVSVGPESPGVQVINGGTYKIVDGADVTAGT